MIDFDAATKGLTPGQVRDCVNQTTLKYFGGTQAMTKFNGKPNVLDATLGEYADYGFQLVEPDDHLTELYFKDKKIATFFQSTVTVAIIREGCQNYLDSIMRGL